MGYRKLLEETALYVRQSTLSKERSVQFRSPNTGLGLQKFPHSVQYIICACDAAFFKMSYFLMAFLLSHLMIYCVCTSCISNVYAYLYMFKDFRDLQSLNREKEVKVKSLQIRN